ncbi:MAG: hypothetical protein NZ824_03485 [Candidatus Thioglobus sp.]|nr:hypothetical protein [Candidatus Thioglobus sp.]
MINEKIAIISNVWTKMISLDKGDIYEGHTHKFDHIHLLSVGEVKIIINGEESIFKAPTQIFIKKGLMHSMECLSDNSVGTCIHPIRNGNRVEDIYDASLCPDYVEDEEALKIYPTHQFIDWEKDIRDNPNAN